MEIEEDLMQPKVEKIEKEIVPNPIEECIDNEEDGEMEDLVDESYSVDDPRRWRKLIEKTGESVIRQYFNNLGLNREMISKAKSILDIGAGNRFFAAYCINEGLNENVYSLDKQFSEKEEHGIRRAIELYFGYETIKKMDKKSFWANMENLPFGDESMELIVVHAAMPGVGYGVRQTGKMKKGIEKSFDEILRVLKPGCEARIFALPNKELGEYWSYWRDCIDEKLDEIRKDGNVFVFEEEVASITKDKQNNDGRLILKKKMEI